MEELMDLFKVITEILEDTSEVLHHTMVRIIQVVLQVMMNDFLMTACR